MDKVSPSPSHAMAPAVSVSARASRAAAAAAAAVPWDMVGGEGGGSPPSPPPLRAVEALSLLVQGIAGNSSTDSPQHPQSSTAGTMAAAADLFPSGLSLMELLHEALGSSSGKARPGGTASTGDGRRAPRAGVIAPSVLGGTSRAQPGVISRAGGRVLISDERIMGSRAERWQAALLTSARASRQASGLGSQGSRQASGSVSQGSRQISGTVSQGSRPASSVVSGASRPASGAVSDPVNTVAAGWRGGSSSRDRSTGQLMVEEEKDQRAAGWRGASGLDRSAGQVIVEEELQRNSAEKGGRRAAEAEGVVDEGEEKLSQATHNAFGGSPRCPSPRASPKPDSHQGGATAEAVRAGASAAARPSGMERVAAAVLSAEAVRASASSATRPNMERVASAAAISLAGAPSSGLAGMAQPASSIAVLAARAQAAHLVTLLAGNKQRRDSGTGGGPSGAVELPQPGRVSPARSCRRSIEHVSGSSSVSSSLLHRTSWPTPPVPIRHGSGSGSLRTSSQRDDASRRLTLILMDIQEAGGGRQLLGPTRGSAAVGSRGSGGRRPLLMRPDTPTGRRSGGVMPRVSLSPIVSSDNTVLLMALRDRAGVGGGGRDAAVPGRRPLGVPFRRGSAPDILVANRNSLEETVEWF